MFNFVKENIEFNLLKLNRDTIGYIFKLRGEIMDPSITQVPPTEIVLCNCNQGLIETAQRFILES